MALVGATPASASDWGGYTNPAYRVCGSNYPVASKLVYNKDKTLAGRLHIKWSNGCPGNYALFEPAGAVWYVKLSIHSQMPPHNKAGTDEDHPGSGNVWTYVIKLNRSTDRVCAYVDVWGGKWYSSPWLNAPSASAALCA